MKRITLILSAIAYCMISCETQSVFLPNLEQKKWQLLTVTVLALYLLGIPLVQWLVGGIKHYQLTKKTKREMLKQKHLQNRQLETEQQNEELLAIQEKLKADNLLYTQTRIRHIENNCEALRCSADWKKDLCWENYDRMCGIVNTHFFLFANKLQVTKNLQEKDIRLCVLVLLDMFDSKQMADILCYAESGIRNYKQKVAQKVGTTSKKLREFLVDLAVSGPIIDTGL